MNGCSPSRHHFALARLLALVASRDLSAIENYAVAIWFYLTTVCYIGIAVSWLAAIPLAVVAVTLPVLSGAGAKANGFILMLLQFLASAHFAMNAGPIRYVAWLFIVVLCMNAIAWVLTRRCGI